MIITRLTLENYKQYRGEQSFPIAEDAIVGVVGANGVGKTTIFEAIEWCLYKPAAIRNTDIRPRTVGGEVRVVVQMTTESGNDVYEVERILKRSATQATVYKLNEMMGSEPIVQGTREVTDFITTRLIGLSHSAFVATFFTRQKELSFFGGLGATDRRREVGKLLGFETIKQAQAIIGEDRAKARGDADALHRRYESLTSGRDLNGEIETISGTIGERIDAVATARDSLAKAEEQVARVEQSNQRLQELRDQDASLAADLRDQQSRRSAVTERQVVIVADLERLDAQQEERATLAPQAARLRELAERRKSLETERERFERQQNAQQEAIRIEQRLTDLIQEVRGIVSSASDGAVPDGWSWSDTDAGQLVEAIDRLSGVAGTIDVSSLKERCGSMRLAKEAFEQASQEHEKLEKYLERCEQLRKQVARLLTAGDPAQLRQQALSKLEELRSRASVSNAEIASLSEQQEGTRHLITRLRQQHFEESCPTCGRPFNDHEAGLVIETMQGAIASHDETISTLRSAVSELSRETRDVQRKTDDLRAREEEVLATRTRIDNSAQYVDEQRAKVRASREKLDLALQELGLSDAPSADDVAGMERERDRRQKISATVPHLQSIDRNVRDALKTRDHAERELAGLTDIAWDQDLYNAVTADHDRASRAVSAIEQIDRQLGRQPQLAYDLEAATTAIHACQTVIAELERVRKELAFDPSSLQRSNDELKNARQRDRDSRDQFHAAERAKREAEFTLETLKKEQRQLVDLAREADERRMTHEELNVMYTEFSEFDQFVAQHLSPMLSDITSDIVTEMTDGKYDRVTFDEDYGIKVFDQSDEGFPLDTFSGGERDAIALAARLALSRIIGLQAANPPGFLVLDEVFGSLDSDRRERVLTLLGQHSTEYFRQMFVISHVDDVQRSPVFDTIWQVEQRDNGSSQVITTESVMSEALTDG